MPIALLVLPILVGINSSGPISGIITILFIIIFVSILVVTVEFWSHLLLLILLINLFNNFLVELFVSSLVIILEKRRVILKEGFAAHDCVALHTLLRLFLHPILSILLLLFCFQSLPLEEGVFSNWMQPITL